MLKSVLSLSILFPDTFHHTFEIYGRALPYAACDTLYPRLGLAQYAVTSYSIRRAGQPTTCAASTSPSAVLDVFYSLSQVEWALVATIVVSVLDQLNFILVGVGGMFVYHYSVI